MRSLKDSLVLRVTLGIIGFGTPSIQAQTGEWRAYASDVASTKYLPLNQISKSNVAQLRIAWRWRSVDEPIRAANPQLWTWRYEATPLMVGGVLYTSTSLSQVAAIRPGDNLFAESLVCLNVETGELTGSHLSLNSYPAVSIFTSLELARPFGCESFFY